VDDLLEADFWPGITSGWPVTRLATDKIHERGGAPGAPPFAASQKTKMSDDVTGSIRASYDQLADEYARRIFNELHYKPLDRELLDRFATEVSGRGEVCDMGCGPGHVARYLRDAGATVFGLDLSPKMLEQARQLSPDMQFREGNMMALDLQEGARWDHGLLCNREHSKRVSAFGVSGNTPSTATWWPSAAGISYRR